MIYIIDANNLAGALGLLGGEKFDQKLVGMIKRYLANKKIDTYLVFDGYDFMGDKADNGYLHVIYTPRDNFYKSADDKIIELVTILSNQSKDEIVVITDDRGLTDAIRIKIGDDIKLKIIKAGEFAARLEDNFYKKRYGGKSDKREEDDDDKDIEQTQEKKINDELLEIWK